MRASRLLLVVCLSLEFLPPVSIAGTVPQKGNGKGFSGMTGNDLLPMCQAAVDRLDGKTISPSRQVDATRCLSYIEGFLDAFVMRDSTLQKPARFCFPYPLNSSEVTRGITKWLAEHQSKLDLPAWALVFDASSEAFACPSPARTQ